MVSPGTLSSVPGELLVPGPEYEQLFCLSPAFRRSAARTADLQRPESFFIFFFFLVDTSAMIAYIISVLNEGEENEMGN